MYICLCRAVTESEVRSAVAEGAADAEEVVERCGAGTGCGGCRTALRDLLATCGITVEPCPLAAAVPPVGGPADASATMTTTEGKVGR